MSVAEQVQVLSDLSMLVEAPQDVREKAAAILQYYGRNVDLGWGEDQALAKAIQKANLCHYGDA